LCQIQQVITISALAQFGDLYNTTIPKGCSLGDFQRTQPNLEWSWKNRLVKQSWKKNNFFSSGLLFHFSVFFLYC